MWKCISVKWKGVSWEFSCPRREKLPRHKRSWSEEQILKTAWSASLELASWPPKTAVCAMKPLLCTGLSCEATVVSKMRLVRE